MRKYTSLCESCIETGVRGVISTYALIAGLLDSGDRREILLNDITPCDITELLCICKDKSVSISYIWKPNLKIELKQEYDLLFIDTWHVYGQTLRELYKFAPFIRKFIILHDTTVDAEEGETIRNGWDAVKQSEETDIPVHEIRRGIWPAITDFLACKKEWTLLERYTNNNGLTVLEKVG